MSNTFKLSKIVRLVLVAAVMSCGASWSEAGFGVFPLVVHSSGPRTPTSGGWIFQPADLPQIVTLEVFMGDMWNLFGYWVDIDCADLSNGIRADLRLAGVSCGVDSDCDAAFGVSGSTCIDGQCQAIFVDTNRANFVFPPACQSAGGFNNTSCAPSIGVGDTSAVGCYDPNAAYVGSIVLEIPADAAGTYVVNISPASTITNQFGTFTINEEDVGFRGRVTLAIQPRIPPNPLANPDPEAVEAARSVGLVFVPQTAVVEPFAVRVTLTSLHHPDPPYTGGAAADFAVFEGQHRWLGPPTQFVESSANPTTFMAATLQCTPHYMDWTTIGLVYVIGREVVPSSTLSVRTFGINCMGREATCTNISDPLEIGTARWGDVQVPFNPPDASAQPDFGDVSALVDKFRDQPGALNKVRTKLHPDIPNMNTDVDFTDISECVNAFKGNGFPFAGPLPCP